MQQTPYPLAQDPSEEPPSEIKLVFGGTGI